MVYSESELISEIKLRNTDAYGSLINTYAKPIYYVVYNILKSTCVKEDMEECVADVLFEAWQRIDEYNISRGSLKTWLLIQAKYKALTYRRRNERGSVVSIEDYEPDDPLTVEKQIIDRETQRKLMDTINTFNETDKELFIRRYLYNERINDLMDTLGLSRSAIDNRLLRSRKIIKEAISYE